MSAYTYGISQAEVGKAEGLDPLTAYAKGAIEGGAMGVSVALPAALTGGLAFRTATGAALNVGVGIPERMAVSTLLRSRGFEEMARQYDPLDSTAIATELVLGAAFGGLLGPRAKGAKLPPPEAIPPSAVDAALVANQQAHAEIDVAPGVPVDTRTRQAHTAAMNQAVESLVMGRDINVESLLKDAGFLGKRPDFDALRVIADELDKAGATDVVAQVRALEAEAQARGLVVEPDTLGSVVLSDKPVEPTMSGPMVKDSKVRIGEDYVPTRLMLVEAQDVQATMMKAENQFRDRTRVASEQQIADMASRLDAALLMDAPVMDYGAPVLAADGTVIGGNGRAAAVGRAYETGAAQAYRDALRVEFGDAVDGMQRPMLVRVLQRDVDVAKAAILSNEGGGLRMSALEQAKVDAERLGDFRAFDFSEDGDLNLVSNMPFIRSWVAEMPQNQRAAIMDADGRLSAEGAGRLRNAILYRAYGDSPTLSRLVEATDPGSRNIAAALTRSAPAVADAREAIDRGVMYPMGLHDDLVAAVEKLDALRRTGLSVADWTKQIDAFGDGMTPEARLLVQFMDQHIRSTRVISDGIFGFYNRLLEAGNPKQGSMFEAAHPDKMRMLTLALDNGAPMYSRGAQADTPEFKAWFGASRVVSADGRPLVVYHGSQTEGFTTPKSGKLLFFASNPSVANAYARDGGVVQSAYLKITNPLEVDAQGGTFNSIIFENGRYGIEGLSKIARGRGHDGLIVRNVDDLVADDVTDMYVSFGRKGQVKSATGNRGAFDQANPDIRFSRATGPRSTVDDLTATFRAMFGRDADRLVQAGRIKFVESADELPAGPHPADVRGMYYGGDSYIVAENTPMSAIRGLALHEIGIHAGFRDMLGDALYSDVLARIEAKVGADPVFAEARALAEARANKPEHVPEETLAYLIENAPELPLVRRVLAAIRQWLYRVTGGRFVDLTQADLQMMAVASLRRYARMSEVEARGEDAPFYMTLFHGSPTAFKPEPGAPLGSLRWRYINTGEGAQAFGYGHYLAQQEWIARTRYRDRLVKRKENEAVLRLEDPNDPGAYIRIGADDVPAYRIGNKVIHENFSDSSLSYPAVAIRLVKDFGYSTAREMETDPARLAALDEVTVEADPIIEKRQFRGQVSYVVNGKGNGFTTLEEAKDYATTVGKQRVLRLDIEEVRPEPPKGALYGKFIPDETWNKMMIWDAPMDAQPENVRAAFQQIGLIKTLEWSGMQDTSGMFRIEKTYNSLRGTYAFNLFKRGSYDALQKFDSLDAAKAEAQRLTGEIFDGNDAYTGLSREINNGNYGDELGVLIQSADMEARARRAPEGSDPAEFDYDPRADELASIIMHQAGIPGHRFLDGETRAAGWDSPEARFNVVLYSDDLGRAAWEAKGEAGKQPTEWVTANGRARVKREDDGMNGRFAVEIDGKQIDYELSIEPALRLAEQALDGQLYSRGATMEPDPIEDTTLPDARLLADQADAEIATATELSQGFIPAVECALRVGA